MDQQQFDAEIAKARQLAHDHGKLTAVIIALIVGFLLGKLF
jgi:hypothetical protein